MTAPTHDVYIIGAFVAAIIFGVPVSTYFGMLDESEPTSWLLWFAWVICILIAVSLVAFIYRRA